MHILKTIASLLLLTTLSLNAQIPNDGLIVWYPFNGDAKDGGPHGNHGTVSGALLAEDRFGDLKGAYYFDGSDDYIRIQYASSLGISTQFTISVWCDFNELDRSTPGYDWQSIVNQGPNIFGEMVRTNVSQGPKIIRLFHKGMASDYSDINLGFDDGKWHHLVTVYNAVEVKYYLDNVLQNNIKVSGAIDPSTDDLFIGIERVTEYPFHGRMDDVRIYNRPLDEMEIGELYSEAGWGDVIPSAVQGPCGTKTVVYDGIVYNTVRIGEQCWLRQNINVGKFEGQTKNSTIEKYCYNNMVENCTKWGGLYNWEEAMQYSVTLGARGICPPGWHIPTSDDFNALLKVVQGEGNRLKAVGEGNREGRGTDVSGFSALLFDEEVAFWTSNEVDQCCAQLRALSRNSRLLRDHVWDKTFSLSVRCLED